MYIYICIVQKAAKTKGEVNRVKSMFQTYKIHRENHSQNSLGILVARGTYSKPAQAPRHCPSAGTALACREQNPPGQKRQFQVILLDIQRFKSLESHL